MIMQERIPLKLSRVGWLSLALLTAAALPAWGQRNAGQSFSSGDQIVAATEVPPIGTSSRAVTAAEPQPARPKQSIARPGGRSDARIPTILDRAAANQSPQPAVAAPQATGAGSTMSLTLDDALKEYVARNLSVSAVRNAYWEFVYATEAAELAGQSLALATKLVKENTIRVAAGTVAPIDITAAKATEATRRVSLLQAESNRRDTESTLKRLIAGGADDPNWIATLNPIDRAELRPDPVDVQAAVRRAVDQEVRPETTDTGRAAALREMELQVRVVTSIYNGYGNLQRAAEAVQAAGLSRRFSAQELEEKQREFDAGTATNYQVVQAQRELSDARTG